MLIDSIPGFRSRNKGKMVLAAIIYLFMLLLLLAAFTGVTMGDKIIGLSRMIVLLGIPYILVTNVNGFRDRLPLLKKDKRTRPKFIAGLAGYLIAGFLVFTVVFAMTESLVSPEQQAVNFGQQQQKHIQAQLEKEKKKQQQAKKEEELLRERVAKAAEEAKGDQTLLKEKLTAILKETKVNSIAIGERLEKTISETKGETKALQEKIVDATREKKSQVKAELNLKWDDAMAEAKGDKEKIKEKLTVLLAEKKEDTTALKQRISKMVDDTKGDLATLKAKLEATLEDTADDLKAMGSKAERRIAEAKQRDQANSNSVGNEKVLYEYVDYYSLLRAPKQYIGKAISNYGRVVSVQTNERTVNGVIQTDSGDLMLFTVPQSKLDLNIMENDFIALYGKYKGVTSETMQVNPAYLLLGVFYMSGSSYNQAMPYIKADYVEIIGW